MRNSPTADQNTFNKFRYIHEQMSSPTSQIVVHHIMCVTRVYRPPHPNGILSSTIQTGWALFSINTTLTAIHMHLISQFACKQWTFQSVSDHNRRIKSRSGDGSRHLGMWWTIVLHISWSTVRYGRLHRGRHCILVMWYTINGKCRCFLGVTFMFLASLMHFNFLMMMPWWKQNFVPIAQNP